MKRCGTCGEQKPLEDFNRKRSRADGRQEVCRECNRAASRRYYARNRRHHVAVIRARTISKRAEGIAFITAHLAEHACVDCGIRDIRVLDFDHRPESDKRDEVMRLVRNGHPITTIATEIGKCDVRCRNCHAIVTYTRMGPNWRSSAAERRSNP